MEEIMRMLTCPCRTETGAVSCRCHELAPKHRCGCTQCISQRLARLETMDEPFTQCEHEQSAANIEPVHAGIAKMFGVPAAVKFVCVLRAGHEGKHAVVPVTK